MKKNWLLLLSLILLFSCDLFKDDDSGPSESESNDTLVTANQLDVGTTYKAAIDPEEDVDYFYFNAEPNQIYEVELVWKSGELDPVLILVNSDDTLSLVDETADFGNETMVITVNDYTGRITFIAAGYWNIDKGTYEISVNNTTSSGRSLEENSSKQDSDYSTETKASKGFPEKDLR